MVIDDITILPKIQLSSVQVGKNFQNNSQTHILYSVFFHHSKFYAKIADTKPWGGTGGRVEEDEGTALKNSHVCIPCP